MVGNNAICYEAVQRICRNALVNYLRVRMSETFIHDHVSKLKRPFAKEWDDLVSNSNAARTSGGTMTAVVDDYDLLSVTHFFGLFDAYFDKLFSAQALADGRYPKPTKTKFLGNLKSIKDHRDPLSHPVEEEMSYEEAFGLLTDVKQILMSLGLTDSAAQITKLMGQLSGFDGHSASELVFALPTQDSIYLDFVGRREVLKQVAEWFSIKSNTRCLLAGDGGKGKSAVAYRFAQELSRQHGALRLIAWLSAKRRKFQDGQVVPLNTPDFADLPSALDKLLVHYGRLSPEEIFTTAEKKECVLHLLNEFPSFLIIDDIDTVLGDTDVVSFFTFDVPATQSRVLLTSRRDIPGIKSFTIQGFSADEADDFIKSRIELYGLDIAAFPPQSSKALLSVTDGSPLYMDDLLRLTKIVPLKTALQLWAEKKGDEARRYALQRELEVLSPDARQVLMAACVGDDPISFPEIETLAALSEDRVLSALDELQTLFLFPKPRVVEGEQRFELNSNTRKLVRLVEGGSDRYARIEHRSRALAGKLPDVGRGIVSALIRQAYLLMTSDRNSEAEALLLQASEKYPQAADLFGFMGFFYRKCERYTDATTRFEQAHKLKCRQRDTYRHWVKMEMSRSEWTQAIAVTEKALKLISDFYEMHALRAECRVRAGIDMHQRLQREKAIRIWTECAGDLKLRLKSPDLLKDGERATNAAMYRTLIICLDRLGEYKELKYFASAWVREHPDDAYAKTEVEKIVLRRGRSIDDLAAQRREVQTSSHPRPYL